MVVPGQHDGQGLEGGPQRCDAGALTGAGGEERGRDGVRRGGNGRRRGRGYIMRGALGLPLFLSDIIIRSTQKEGAQAREDTRTSGRERRKA